jgi:hypothetical protein
MSANKDKRHVMVLPEDNANRQLAVGFYLQIESNRQRRMQILRPARGWTNVIEQFVSVHAREMKACGPRFMVMLLDFDSHNERLEYVRARIPTELAHRVFVIGVWSEPEALRQGGLGSYEKIGSDLAKDCREGTDTFWGHELLRHNAAEIDRLRQHVRPILFPSKLNGPERLSPHNRYP